MNFSGIINKESYTYKSIEEAYYNLESLTMYKCHIIDKRKNLNEAHVKAVCAHLAYGKIELDTKYNGMSKKINKAKFKRYRNIKFAPKLYINTFEENNLVLQASSFNYLNQFDFGNIKVQKNIGLTFYLEYNGKIDDVNIKYNGRKVQLAMTKLYQEKLKNKLKGFTCLKWNENQSTTTYWLENVEPTEFNNISGESILSQALVDKNIQKITFETGTKLLYNDQPLEYDKSEVPQKSLGDFKDVYIFMNDPQSGGIEDQIKFYIKKYRELGVEKIYYVCRDYSEFSPDVLFDETTLDVDGIYIMSNNAELDQILSRGNNLLHFTFPMIAAHFTGHFWNNAVIVQYHGNIDHIDSVHMQQLKGLKGKIATGEVQLIADQLKLDNEYPYLEARSISNYSTVTPINLDEQSEIKKDKIKVGYVGRLKKDKNIKGLIKTISKVLDASDEFEFHIFGDGNERYRFDIFPSNVILHGVESDKDIIYKDLDYLILPSLVESFGMVLVEALAYGVMPISIRNSDAINTILPSNEIGYIVESEEEMAEVILNKPNYNQFKLVEHYQANFYEKNYRFNDSLFKINVLQEPEKPNAVVYNITEKDNFVYIKFFINPYKIIDKNKLVLNCIFTNNAHIEKIENTDYKYYSNLSKNFVDNFITLRFNIDEIETIDYVEAYYNSERLHFHPVAIRNVFKVNKLENSLKILVGSKVEFVRENVDSHMTIVNNTKDIVLFQDRALKADDNAEVMYRNTSHPQISKFFVLDRKSIDFVRLVNEGFNVVEFGSLKHKQLYLKTKVLVSSHAQKREVTPMYQKERDSSNYHHMFLQHGITHDSRHNFVLNPINSPLGTFCVSNQEEYDLVHSFGYSEETIIISGMARDNNAKSNRPNTILYFPHWTFDDEDTYFENINSFINSNELAELLAENNYKFKYVMHSMVSEKINKINIPVSENIEVITNNEVNYKNLLNNINLLITSSSSLRFDAFARKVNAIHYLPANEQIGEYFDYFDKYYNEKEMLHYLKNNIAMDFPLNADVEIKYNTFFANHGNEISSIRNRIFDVLGYSDDLDKN